MSRRNHLFKILDVASALHITPQTLRKWVSSRPPRIKAIRLSRHWRIAEDELRTYLHMGPEQRLPGRLEMIAHAESDPILTG